METLQKKYVIVPSEQITSEGVSLYRILREADFTEELLENYFLEIKKRFEQKLRNVSIKYRVPKKEITDLLKFAEEMNLVSSLKAEREADNKNKNS